MTEIPRNVVPHTDACEHVTDTIVYRDGAIQICAELLLADYDRVCAELRCVTSRLTAVEREVYRWAPAVSHPLITQRLSELAECVANVDVGGESAATPQAEAEAGEEGAFTGWVLDETIGSDGQPWVMVRKLIRPGEITGGNGWTVELTPDEARRLLLVSSDKE